MKILKFCIFFVPAVLVLHFMFSAVPAQANQPEARQALEATVNEVLAELNKQALKNPATRAASLERIEAIIVNLFCFDELSMRTVGPSWQNFTSDQQQRFIDAFKTLLRARYTGALEGYNGGSVTYGREAPVGSSTDKVQIDTTVNLPDKSVPMHYRLIMKDKWMVYDIIIEGVSMVQNYRSQFQSVLSKNDPEELIRLVKQKAEESAAQNK